MRGSRRLIAGLVLIALAGCAPADLAPSPTVPEPTSTTLAGPTTTTLSPSAGAVRFEACLRAEGLEIAPIPLDGRGRLRLELVLARVDFSVAANVTALDRCAHHLTGGALSLDGSPVMKQAVMEMLNDFSVCVRSRGVRDFPDPRPDFNGVGTPYPMDRIPFHHPGLQDAVDECRDRMRS